MAAVLCSLGDLVEDVVVRLREPMVHATDTACTVVRRRGGSAANVAAFAASTGAPARFVGQVGADRLGEVLVEDLAGAGVDVRVRRRGRTGTIVVLVDPEGERTMLSDRGSSTELDRVPVTWLADVTILHVPAYSLGAEPVATAARDAIATVRSWGGLVSIDASSVRVIEAMGVESCRALIEAIRPDVLFANADEAAVLGVQADPLHGIGTLVVKRGPRPTLVQLGGGRPAEVPVPPAGPVEDTTGAGDAFAAGYLCALAAGAAPLEAAAAGNRLAVTVITRSRSPLESP